MKILEIKDLYFKYRNDSAMRDFSVKIDGLDIEKGSNLAIFGKSGSGKSTLLKICAGLQKGFTGHIKLFGQPLAPSSREAAGRDALLKTAVLFQDAPLFNCGVYENIAIGLKIKKYGEAHIKKAVDEIIEKMNLSDIARAHSSEISGGQARRVCLARVLVLKPGLLFLDEPFYSLDALNRAEIMHELKLMSGELDITLMLVTHDKNEALALCDKMAVIDAGTLIRYDSVRECFGNPRSEIEAKLLGREMIFYGTVIKCENEVAEIKCAPNTGLKESGAYINNGNISGNDFFKIQAAGSYLKDERVCVIINPQDISIGLIKKGSDENDETTSVLNNYEGVVESAVHYEFGMLLNISIGKDIGFQAYITSKSYERLNLSRPEKVKVSVKATAVKSFLMP
jgi:ABC-type sulfate/molybdate transport systems ATPase subunit